MSAHSSVKDRAYSFAHGLLMSYFVGPAQIVPREVGVSTQNRHLKVVDRLPGCLGVLGSLRSSVELAPSRVLATRAPAVPRTQRGTFQEQGQGSLTGTISSYRSGRLCFVMAWIKSFRTIAEST